MRLLPTAIVVLLLHVLFFGDVLLGGRSLSPATFTSGLTPSGPYGAPQDALPAPALAIVRGLRDFAVENAGMRWKHRRDARVRRVDVQPEPLALADIGDCRYRVDARRRRGPRRGRHGEGSDSASRTEGSLNHDSHIR